MSHVDQGTTGAYRQTWRKGNPRSLLQTIVSRNAKASKEELWKLFWEEIAGDEELLKACGIYWFDNNLNSLLKELKPDPPGPTGAPTGAAGEQAMPVTAIKEKLRRRIEYETKLALLELIMPNEKRLADCTGTECQKFGGWLTTLARKVPANKTVGDTLTEEQVRKAWQFAQKKKK